MNRSYQTEDPQPTRDPRRRLLRPQERLPLEALAWRLLPRDFPPWETVYWWFGRWRTDGTFERLNAALRERLRSRLGRAALSRCRVQASPIPKRPRAPGSAGSRGALSRQQEGQGPKAALARGHRGFGAQGQGAQCEGPLPQDGLR